MRKSSKQQNHYIKSLKSKNPEHKLIYKSYKNFFEKLGKKFKQNYYSNLLEKHKDNANNDGMSWKKSQENFRRKISLHELHLKRKTELYLIETLLLKNSIHFFTNIGPNLSKTISQISKLFDKYFSLVDTQINNHDLTLREFETAYKSLKRHKASGIDDINSSNIILDFFEEFKISLFYIFFLKNWKLRKLAPHLKEVITYRLQIIDQSQSFQ